MHSPLMAMPLGNDEIVRAAVPGARCVLGDWWDHLVIRHGITTTLTPANHCFWFGSVLRGSDSSFQNPVVCE